jgi:opacity protein-like surface antigen
VSVITLFDGFACAPFDGRAGDGDVRASHKLDSFGTLRGRFGTTLTPGLMAYATGGLAVGSIRSTVSLADTGFDGDGNPGLVSHTVSKLTRATPGAVRHRAAISDAIAGRRSSPPAPPARSPA